MNKSFDIDIDNVVKITTMPKIFSQLEIVGDEINKRLAEINNMQVSEETKQEAKKTRADINRTLELFEKKRKEIKKEILKDYELFNEKYELEVKDKLTNADKTLKEKIDTIEITQREEKIKELLSFTKEYIVFNGLENIVEPKQVLPNVTLTKSLKSLKDEIKGQLERIANEVQIIKTEEYANEVMVKYLENGFDYPKAKLDVINQHKKMEELDTSIFNEVVVDNYKEFVPKQEEVVEPPKEILEEELIECTFTVNATKEQLIQIKNYLQELGVKYE